jgi:hypothetical protein
MGCYAGERATVTLAERRQNMGLVAMGLWPVSQIWRHINYLVLVSSGDGLLGAGKKVQNSWGCRG